MRRPASEEGYELTIERGEGLPVEVAPEPETQTPGEWIRRNLFSSSWNGILTVLMAAVAVWVAVKAIGFVFVDAEWTVLKVHLRVYMVGRFPLEQMWRVWVDIYALALLVGLSRGVLAPKPWTVRRIARWVILAGAAATLILSLVDGSLVRLLVAGAVGVIVVGVVVGRVVGRRLRRALVVSWILAFPFVVIVLRAFDGVKPDRWGGLLLNVIVAVVAIFVSFPIGILLALGRRSALPLVRTFCVGFIEFIRGVPLVALLFFGVFAFELFLPPGVKPPNIVLAMTMYVVFSSAYVAEIVRGGLQGVPDGQYEASRALGLRFPRMMGYVVLPQALRNTIPSMISHFISLWKDTSLLAALVLFSDLLSAARRSTRFEFAGHAAEALLPAALLFWLVAYSMARWSQRVEKRVGVGER